MYSGSHEPEFLSKLKSAQHEMSERIEKYVDSWNKGDMNTVMGTFVDEGLDYTDYGVMLSHMDKPTLREFFADFSEVCGDLKINTISVHGAHDFCVWEVQTEFIVQVESPGIPFEKGKRAILYSASLIWWNMEGKIVKEVDYAVWKK